MDGLFARIADGARALVAQGQLYGRDDVQRDGDEQDDAHGPEQLTNAVQKRSIRVQFGGALEDLEIAQQVGDHEAKHHDAGNRHDDFLTHGGGPEAGCPIGPRGACKCAHLIFSVPQVMPKL